MNDKYKQPAPGPGQRLNTPLYDRPLRVSAADYLILKRQVAKLRADFAEYLYSISEPIPKESEKPRICPKCNVPTVYYDGCLGYESFQCPICHWDVNDPEPIPEESEPTKEEIDQRKIDQDVERGLEDQAFSEYDSDKAKEWGGIDK